MTATSPTQPAPTRLARRRSRERRSIATLAIIIVAGAFGRGWIANARSPVAVDTIVRVAAAVDGTYDARALCIGSDRDAWPRVAPALVAAGRGFGRVTRPAMPFVTFQDVGLPGPEPWYLGPDPIDAMTPSWFLLRPREVTTAQLEELRHWRVLQRTAGLLPERSDADQRQPAVAEPRMAPDGRGTGVLSPLVARTASGQDTRSAAWTRRSDAIAVEAEAGTLQSITSVTAGLFLLSILIFPLGLGFASQACQQPRAPPGPSTPAETRAGAPLPCEAERSLSFTIQDRCSRAY